MYGKVINGDLNINGKLSINSYSLPTEDGTIGQVIQTNGSGTASWVSMDILTVEAMSVSDKSWSALLTTSNGSTASNNTVTETPVDGSYVEVKVNGIEYEVGDGVKTKDCYFSGDGGTNARGFSSSNINGQIQTGDKLYWNGSIVGFELTTSLRISLNYLITKTVTYSPISSQVISRDDKSWVSLTTTFDGGTASNNTITSQPVDGSYVEVKVNGIEYEVGDAVKTTACYFSGDGGVTPRSFDSSHVNDKIQPGDKLYWNGSIIGFELLAGWRISLNYLKN